MKICRKLPHITMVVADRGIEAEQKNSWGVVMRLKKKRSGERGLKELI